MVKKMMQTKRKATIKKNRISKAPTTPDMIPSFYQFVKNAPTGVLS